jgi:hypothetical protein
MKYKNNYLIDDLLIFFNENETWQVVIAFIFGLNLLFWSNSHQSLPIESYKHSFDSD